MVDFPYKIVVPQLDEHHVVRPRLNEAFANALHYRLITLSGPAGYGKTSLLVDFANNAPLSVCWYTIDAADRDPWIFLDYVIESVEKQFPQALQQTKKNSEDKTHISLSHVVKSLSRDFSSIRHKFIFVLDDWHFVDDVLDIKGIVSYLVTHCLNCHFVLSSRSYPSLPNMMLLASRGQMYSLHKQQLRFTGSEVMHILKTKFNIGIEPDQATTLVEQTEGWITGIILLCQASNIEVNTQTLSTDIGKRQVYHFLAEQVLAQQPPQMNAFLLDTSLLEELTPEICDTIFQRDDSRRFLELLLQRHLFISEIRPNVLRYERLFGEFLREHFLKVNPQLYYQRIHQIADFYAANKQWLHAFDCYITAGALTAAQEIVAQGGERLYENGHIVTLEKWFAELPLEQINAPLLCLKARVAMKRGDHARAQTLVQMAEVRLKPDEQVVVWQTQAQVARVIGRYEQALVLAQQVLAETNEPAQQSIAMRTLGICYHRLGQTEQAITHLKAALTIETACGNMHSMAQLKRDLGICHKDVGKLRQAEAYFADADSYWAMFGNITMRALSLNSKGGVQHSTGQYQEAYETLSEALQCARDAFTVDYEAMVWSSLGDLYSDLQLWDQAHHAYEQAMLRGGSAHLATYVHLATIRLLLRQRHYKEAIRKLRYLPQTNQQRWHITVLLLNSIAAQGSGDFDVAIRELEHTFQLIELSESPKELAWAYLRKAALCIAIDPTNHAAVIAALDKAVHITEQIGQRIFLVNEALHTEGLLRYVQAAEWPYAQQWAEMHEDIVLVASRLKGQDSATSLIIRTFGSDQIIYNHESIDIGWSKAREVFYYLLIHPEGVTAERLRETIWPHLSGKRSRDALSSAIYQLRSILPRELIALQGRQVYYIDRQIVQIDHDAERFQQLLDDPTDNRDLLFEAIKLYRGPYLVAVDNEWCQELRSYLERRYVRALHSGATEYRTQLFFAEALELYQRILAVDEFDESAHEGIMRCQYALGNRAAAIAQYHKLRQMLDEELGIEPTPSASIEKLYMELLDNTPTTP